MRRKECCYDEEERMLLCFRSEDDSVIKRGGCYREVEKMLL
jgi:hypothetical protein